MKISTLRSLLIVGDLLAILAAGYIVYDVWQEKRERAEEVKARDVRILNRLEEIQPQITENRRRAETGRHVSLDLGNRPPPPPPVVEAASKEPERTTTAAPVAPPLDQVVTLIGFQAGTAEATMVLYTRADDPGANAGGGASVPPVATSRPGPPTTGRIGPTTGGPGTRPMVSPVSSAAAAGREIHTVYSGEGIEVGQGFVAILREVRPEGAVFVYDQREVVLALPEPEAAPGAAGRTGSSAATAAAEAAAPVTEDPATWVEWTPERPTVVQLTASGIASMRAKGDQILDDVRWEQENVPDRGRTRPAIKVTNVPPGSVLARAGLQAGDAILSINGTDVSSRTDIVNYVRANDSLPTYTVRMLSRGSVVTRTIRRP